MERGFNSTPHLQMRSYRVTSRIRGASATQKDGTLTLYTLLFGGTGIGVL